MEKIIKQMEAEDKCYPKVLENATYDKKYQFLKRTINRFSKKDIDIKHRWKVIDANKAHHKMLLDIDNGCYSHVGVDYALPGMDRTVTMGRYRQEKEAREKRQRRAWSVLWVTVIILIIYSFITQ